MTRDVIPNHGRITVIAISIRWGTIAKEDAISSNPRILQASITIQSSPTNFSNEGLKTNRKPPRGVVSPVMITSAESSLGWKGPPGTGDSPSGSRSKFIGTIGKNHNMMSA
jgi:hypothetical protein